MKHLTTIALALGFAASFALLCTQYILGSSYMTQEELDYRHINITENSKANIVTLNEYNEYLLELSLYLIMVLVTGTATIKHINKQVNQKWTKNPG